MVLSACRVAPDFGTDFVNSLLKKATKNEEKRNNGEQS